MSPVHAPAASGRLGGMPSDRDPCPAPAPGALAAADAPPLLDLSLNEGAPPPAETLRRLLDGGPQLLAKYPDPAPLEAAYAAFLGAGPAQVLATTGGDDAIDRIVRVHGGPGCELVFPSPTFEVIANCGRQAGATLRPVEHEWGRSPVGPVLDAVTEKTTLVAVVSPNNPTGCAVGKDDWLRLVRALPEDVVLMADLAYVEFAGEDPTPELMGRPNVVLVRTLSKAWGLAGLRVGFAVGEAGRIAELRRCGGPFPVSGVAVAVATERLTRGADAMREFAAAVRRRRERIAELLRAAGGAPVPSQANFVLARMPDVRWTTRGLEAQGVRVRRFGHLPEHVRVAAPADDEGLARLERALRCLSEPEAVLFDMDGVLADVRRSYREAIAATCRSYGVEVGSAEIEAAKAKGGANDDWALTRSLLRDAGVDASLDGVRERFEEAYQGTPDAPGLRRFEALIPDRDWLAALAGRFRLGVVTGRPRRDARRFLEEHGLARLFGAVVCREDAPLKPDPAPVRLALRQLGAGSAWMFGDTPDDIVAARGAGAAPVGVVPPGAGPKIRAALRDAGAARIVDAADPEAWRRLPLTSSKLARELATQDTRDGNPP